MFKFLRKYDKWILAVGGSLLMITFLAPQAIEGLSQYSAQTGASWAQVGAPPKTVTQGDAELLRRQTRMINNLGPQSALNQLGVGSDPAHWYLLVREAQAAGFVGGPASGLEFANAIAQQSGEDINGQMVIATLGGQSGLGYAETVQTLAEIRGVSELMSMVTAAGRFSDTRLRGTAARRSMGISADVVVIDARKDGSLEIPAQDDAAIKKQFDEFSDVAAGEGDRGFGYRIPDRFSIEWLVVPKTEVRASLEDSPELGPIQLRKAFQRDPAKFGVLTSTTATPPTFGEREEQVRTKVLDDLVEQRMKAIAKFGDDRLQFPRRSLSRRGLHYELPNDWASRRTSMQMLADDIANEFNLPQPPYRSTGDELATTQDLSDTDRFGTLSSAGTQLFGRTRTATPQLVNAMREFQGSDTIPVQSGVAFPALTDTAGDLIFARVVSSDPAHAPADVAEVRDMVASDLEAVVKFQTLEDRIGDIEREARTDGLRSVATAYDVPMEFASDIRIANLEFLLQYGITVGSSIPGLGTDSEAIEAVIERAMKLDPTRPLAEQSIDDRVFAIPVPGKLSVLVVSVQSLKPLTEETWKRLATDPVRLQTTMTQDLASMDPRQLFGLDALKDRHAFELSRSEDEDEDADGDADPTTEDSTT